MKAPKKSFEVPMQGVPWTTFEMPVSGAYFKAYAKEAGYHELDIKSCYHKHEIAKVVDRPSYVFVVTKIARFNAKTNKLYFDDFDLFIRPDSLVTVEENSGTLDDRVKANFPRSDDKDAGDISHLVYALLDEIVSDYLTTLDHLGESINAVEAGVWNNPSPQMLQRIFTVRRSLIEFRRNAGGMREVVGALIRDPRVKTSGDLENYYRDLYEHVIRVIEFIETHRDVLNGTLDIYLSALAQRTNEISKVLAVVGTIALPFIILTGMYGMNIPLPFQDSPHAFGIVFGLMIAFGVIALSFFKRKNWF
jgi:magnesium transporter